MIRWLKKNWLYILIFCIILVLGVLFCVVNQIHVIYLLQNPSPEFISAVVIVCISILYLILMIIINTRAML